MDGLPNGFTGFAGVNKPDDFESAGEASRRRRGLASDASHGQASGPSRNLGAFARHIGSFEPARAPSEEIPFDQAQVDAISAKDLRWAWVEVDLAAIRHNIAQTRRFLQPRCRIMAVVKADAYGHGAPEVSKAALGAGADRLAVASVSEALDLRHAGITAPILLLSQPPEASAPALLHYRITPAIYDPQFAIAYGEAADLHGMKAPYHLAVNTGMNRIGVRFDEALEFLRQVSFHRALELEGVFTHYATADNPEVFDFQIQARRFFEVVEGMRAAGFDPGIVHSANSAASFRFPDVHFDMVRLGTALYGFHPCMQTRGRVDLRPAMGVRARIVDTRMPAVSEGVSNGFSYRSPGSVKICTIPLGYADGLRLELSGKIDFVMGGRYWRQVGEICMDQCMFEVDMRPSAARERIDPQVGDEVIVVGGQGAAQVSMEELAGKLHTVPGELACGFARRLQRVYR